MEEALVYEVRATGLLLFVPRFHLRSAVRLVDRAGRVTPPADSDADLDAGADAFAAAARRALRLESGAPASTLPYSRQCRRRPLRHRQCLCRRVQPRA